MAELVAGGGADVGEVADGAGGVEGDLFFAELGAAVGRVGVEDNFGVGCGHGVGPLGWY